MNTTEGWPAERTAVVTGAGSPRGIGRGVAERLAAGGWHLGLMDLGAAALEDAAAELRDRYGVRVVARPADISSADQVDVVARDIEAELPPVLAVVNVAGIGDPTPLLQTSLERWERVLRVNATGTFIVTTRFAPGMVERGVGRVVCLSSTAAQTGGGTYSAGAYAASKAAVEGMARGLALELAPRGVTVNAVAPAVIDTDIMGGRITPERAPTFLAGLPVGRLGRVSEVAGLIEFLCGPDAGYITGATYNVNGGARIG